MSTYIESAAARDPHLGLTVYATIGVAIVGFLFLTNWPTYSFIVRGGPSLVGYYVLPCILIIPIACAHPQLTVRFAREPIFWWMIVFVLSGVVWMTFAQNFGDDAMRQWRPRLAALGLFYTIVLLASQAKRSTVALMIVLCVLIACASTWYDVLRPNKFVAAGLEYEHSGRGAGLFVNPNIAAAFIAMGTLAALPLISMRVRGLLIVCAAAGIVPTFSRSGYIYAVILLIMPMLMRLLSRAQTLLILLAVPALIAVVAGSYDYLMQASDDQYLHNVVRRLQWFQGLEAEDEAVEGRMYGARIAWNMFLDAPLAGAGIGATLDELAVKVGPHNMYLMLMAEQGFFGLALYLSLIWLVARRGRELVRSALDHQGREIGKVMMLMALLLFTFGFFSHNVLEEPHVLFLLSFITAAAFEAPRALNVWTRAPLSAFRRAPAGSATSG